MFTVCMPVEKSKKAEYQIKDKIGMGMYGEVYKGISTNEDGDNKVAIKILLRPTASNFFKESAYLQLFSKNRVICEKYVACLRDVYFVGQTPRLVYDFVNGVNLERIIQFKRNTAKNDLTIAVHLITGLNYFFRLGVYHLDIKPANIMIDTNTRLPKFVDWGSACFTRKITSLLEGPPTDPRRYIQDIEKGPDFESLRNSSTAAGYNNCVYGGTPAYSPPEIIEIDDARILYLQNKHDSEVAKPALEKIKKIVSEHVTLFENNLGKLHDIWSLGVTLLEWYGEDFKYIDSKILYEENQDSLFNIIDKSITNDFIKTILKLMLTIDTAERLKNWDTVVKMVSEYCLSNDATTNKGCPTESDTESINEFIRDAHSTSIDNWYAANIDPLEPRPTGQFNRITLDMLPNKSVIDVLF